jgi:hypothetical protein
MEQKMEMMTMEQKMEMTTIEQKMEMMTMEQKMEMMTMEMMTTTMEEKEKATKEESIQMNLQSVKFLALIDLLAMSAADTCASPGLFIADRHMIVQNI